ncbi:outer membrane lipoprotein-sorting protein [Halorhabdus salina]|uniref:outer membrane lipoprotein-sorting protein n=1 Tax=Halorhabdus salina TaxID=2750670 RepID=UPI0015EE5E1C|nr:DUF4367 domain-containing protein [Halorhabdus salina]
MFRERNALPLLTVVAVALVATSGLVGFVAAESPTTVTETDPAVDTSTAEDVIESFRDRLSSLETVSFTETSVTEANNDTYSSTRRIVVDRESNQKRTERLGGANYDNTTTVINESSAVKYNEDENRVQEYEYNSENLLPTLAALAKESAVEYEYRGTDTVEGTDVYVLEGTPREEMTGDAETTLTVYVDIESNFPVQMKSATDGEDYSYSATVTYENVTLNEELPESTFELDVPEDATRPGEPDLPEITSYDDYDALQSNATLSVPAAELADGFTFDRASIVDGDSYTSMTVSYSNENEHVTVSVRDETFVDYSEVDRFEEVSIGNETGWYYSHEESDYGFLRWTQDDQSYSVFGEFNESELIDITASVATQ